MSNREITYERNLTGSYMIISAPASTDMDEKLMLHRKLPGLLPVEKAYVDGSGQYWYNISGKQSLDCYCSVREIGMEFIERMIISICNEMETLEWNLIQTKCLVLEPELVFITSLNREFIFTIYPENDGCAEKSFQQLMEYLLTKIDHKDAEAVRASYGIYERTLEEGFSISEIRDCISRAKNKALSQITAVTAEEGQTSPWPAISETVPDLPVKTEPDVVMEKNRKESGEKTIKNIITDKTSVLEWLKSLVFEKFKDSGLVKPEGKGTKKEKKKTINAIIPVCPEEEMYVPPQPVIRPTVCLATCQSMPRGVLIYQGNGQMADIHLNAAASRIGCGENVEVKIEKETVSQLHARIEKEGDSYYIEDLNSTNGTFVNDEPLVYKERRKLNSNDIVCFADARYRFG